MKSLKYHNRMERMGTEEKNIRAYLEEMRIGEELIFEVLDFRNTYA